MSGGAISFYGNYWIACRQSSESTIVQRAQRGSLSIFCNLCLLSQWWYGVEESSLKMNAILSYIVRPVPVHSFH